MLVDFVHHDSDSVSINVVHHSSHTDQNIKTLIKSIKILIKKSIKKQLKHLVSTFVKMSLILYTAEFYSSVSWLWLKVKKVADWMKYNIIHSKISWNSRAYKMKNMWLWSLIQYIVYWIKHVISSWCLFAQSIFWIWDFVNIDLTCLFMLVLELLLVVSNHFESIS